MRRPLLDRLLCSAVAGALLAPASAASVTIRVFTPGSLEAQQHPPVYSTTFDRLANDGEITIGTPTALPAAGSLVTTQGESLAITDYDLSDSGFVFGFAHTRGAAGETQAASGVDLFFSVDVETGYAFSGSYAAADPAGRFANLYVHLLDDSTLDVLFLNSQDNSNTSNTPDPSFVLGSLEPDGGGQLEGSLTGTLLPGRWYQLLIGASIDDYFDEGPAATGSGTVSLQFAPVPEPATAALVTGGVLVLAVSHRRQQKRSRPT